MNERLNILTGDWVERLRELPAESAQCVVTSPPYWGLRDYGVAGQLGLEKSPREYVAKLVAGFAEVWRVLRADGSLWLNLGDSYANKPGQHKSSDGIGAKQSTNRGSSGARGATEAGIYGLKPKDLVGIPWMVAFALRDAGWYLRSDIIWHKPNPMPESVTDRPTKSHEYLFLLTKSARYFYNAEAILEPCSPNTNMRVSQDVANQIGSTRAYGGAKTNGNMKAVVRAPKSLVNGQGVKNNVSFAESVCLPVHQRNKRSVWTIGTQAYREAHFATFPEELVKPCILAGSRPGDLVLDPFGGSGTTGQVALELGRRAVLIELNPEYVKLIEGRCKNVTFGLGLVMDNHRDTETRRTESETPKQKEFDHDQAEVSAPLANGTNVGEADVYEQQLSVALRVGLAMDNGQLTKDNGEGAGGGVIHSQLSAVNCAGPEVVS